MWESGYYPPGLENDPNAPWNEVELPSQEFDVVISTTLSKSLSLTTTDYIPKKDYPEEGIREYIDTSETNWHNAYTNDGHYTPRELINLFKERLSSELRVLDEKIEGYLSPEKDDTVEFKRLLGEKRYLEHLISECSNWMEDEIEVIED